jgi:PAS domain S-box-containing protein
MSTNGRTGREQYRFTPSPPKPLRFRSVTALWPARTAEQLHALVSAKWLVQLATVFLAYFVAGKLGQATTSIRSSNLGPVWPAYGVALAAFLAYGYRVWPAVAASAFLVAAQGAVSPLAAAGQTVGATVASAAGAFFLRRIPDFDPSLPRLRDALGLVVVGALGSAMVSASIGLFSLYATGIQAYSGLGSAWLIYWLGDSTGVLLVTPVIFTLPGLLAITSPRRAVELAALLVLLTATCFVVFGDLPLVSVRLHVLAFAVLPFVMWGAINFGTGGAALSVFLTATIATLLTAFGWGPFAKNTPFINAVLLDVLFGVLAISGLALAAVINERERAESDREQLIREQAGMEERLRLAAIVESSDDAILSTDLDGVILSWNEAAQRIFGYTAEEAIGQRIGLLIPPDLIDEERRVFQKLRAGERIVHFDANRLAKGGSKVNVSVTISPLRDASGTIVGAARIARDIGEQKRVREALASVGRRLIVAQEQERTRIARELHDDIGQRLALLTIELASLPASEPGEAARLQQQASEIAADVQALSHELHSSSKVELLGIAKGVELFCNEFAKQQKVDIDFESQDLPSHLPSDISLCLFRILQEALHNSAKHSGVRSFEVRLWRVQGEVHLMVRDRGVGFNVEESKVGAGIGLVSMEERVKLVNGLLSIDSQPQRGTTIHARVPVDVRSVAMNS